MSENGTTIELAHMETSEQWRRTGEVVWVVAYGAGRAPPVLCAVCLSDRGNRRYERVPVIAARPGEYVDAHAA